MRIVILSDYFDDRGGAVGVAKALAFGLKNFGHDVSVITTTQNKTNTSIIPIMEVNGNESVPVYYVYSNYNLFWRPYLSLYNSQTVKAIKKIIDKIKPDVVHAHNIHIHLSYHSLKLAKKTSAKVFLTIHDTMLFHYGKITEFNYKISVWQQIKRAGKTYNPFRNIIICYYLKYVDKIFAVSNALKHVLNVNGIYNVEVVHNGIDVNAWRINEESIQKFKNRYNIENKKVIFFGGRINKEKGMMMMVVLKEIIKKIPRAMLLVATKIDNAAENMITMASDWGIEDKIVITGWLTGSELKAAYLASDIIVTPSIYFDSFPTINLEAMACKKPIIATCFGGSREAVIDGKTGYIVNPFNTKEMADKVIALLENPEKARAFGEAGYERVKNEFNLDKMINNYLEWYKK